MYKYATAIGVDIGRTMVRTAIVRYDGKIFDTFSFPFSGKPDREMVLATLKESIIRTKNKATDYSVNPLCIGIAVKGFVDHIRGIVLGPGQGIGGWTDVNLSKVVKSEFGLPVFIDNDATLMALAEINYGKGRGYTNLIFVTLRSGIGGAVFIDGKLFRGNGNASGEFGQMSIDYNGPESNTGIKGSLEYYASSVALVESYIMRSGRQLESIADSSEGMRAIDVFKLSYAGDTDAIESVKENALYIGTGIANLISVFAPEIVVLGGGMAMAGGSYIDMIKERAFENSLSQCNRSVIIASAELGDSAALLGASYYALKRLDGKNV